MFARGIDKMESRETEAVYEVVVSNICVELDRNETLEEHRGRAKTELVAFINRSLVGVTQSRVGRCRVRIPDLKLSGEWLVVEGFFTMSDIAENERAQLHLNNSEFGPRNRDGARNKIQTRINGRVCIKELRESREQLAEAKFEVRERKREAEEWRRLSRQMEVARDVAEARVAELEAENEKLAREFEVERARWMVRAVERPAELDTPAQRTLTMTGGRGVFSRVLREFASGTRTPMPESGTTTV